MSQLHRIESPEDRRRLLRLARETAGRILGGAGGPAPPDLPKIEGRFGGAFVTFWAGKRLRGCVGTFASTDDIRATIQSVTRSSLADPRFVSAPVTAAELVRLTIEISILSDPQPTSDPASMVPGVHGIIVRRGGRSGCFLPKVAGERGWSAEETLTKCCTMKAGLGAHAWREPDTEVCLFTADAFDERELG